MTPDPRVVAATASSASGYGDGYVDLAHSALWMRSLALRDVMAAVLKPNVGYASLRDSVRAGSAVCPDDSVVARRWVRLALTVGYQQLEPEDIEVAIAMFGLARAVLPVAQWEPDEVQCLVKLLWLADRSNEIDTELFDRIEPQEASFLALDLINRSEGVSSERWLKGLNEILISRDVAPIGLAKAGDTPFDRLSSAVESATVRGPLVSVIMSAFKPGPEIFSAVGSILDQTWADLELLVVDDASGPEFSATLDRVAALDARVRVLRQSVNQGTYAARNLAIGASDGEFITFHDSDDWSHPERVERQMRPLLERPEFVGTHSGSVRATQDLVFQCLGYPTFRRLNASSHLFRRSVLDRLGGFDRVRKGGDTEFHLRLDAAFPQRSLRVWKPLAFVRLGSDSLSRADFRPGWWHSDRAEYRDAMFLWHQAIERGADPKLSPGLTQWPLTAPHNFLRGSGVERAEPDALVIADWRAEDTLHRAAIDAIRSQSFGRRVGIVQVRSLRVKNTPEAYRLSRSVRQAIAAGEVDVVALEEESHVSSIVVLQPDVLQFSTVVPVGLSSDRVEIVDDGGEGVRWSRADVERVARDWFGVEPAWRQEPSPSIDPTLLRTPRDHFRGPRPVVGWIAESDGSDLPADPAEVSQAYPAGAAVDVRLVGVRQPLLTAGIPLERSWLVYEPEDVTVRELWHQVDFAVAIPNAPRRSALERTVGEALTAGCVVILPPRFASWFGDAIVAAEPSEMMAVVRDLWSDRLAYAERVSRGRTWLLNNLSG